MELSKGELPVMKRLRTSILGFAGLALMGATGCSLCCSPYTDDYVTYGSRTPRVDRKHGRIGSVFSDPQATAIGNQSPILSSGDLEGVPLGDYMEDTIDSGSVTLGPKGR